RPALAQNGFWRLPCVVPDGFRGPAHHGLPHQPRRRANGAGTVNRSLWPAVAMLLGLALVVGSAFSGVVAPAWTEAEGVQRQKAAADFHAANYNLPLHDDSSGSGGGKAPDY